MRVLPFLALLFLSSGCVGSVCGPSCQKIYGSDEGECAIPVPGYEPEELLAQCLDMCREAASVTGDVGDYDPDERVPSNQEVTLENRAQAKLWAECIEQTDCSDINDGYCAPIY